MTRAFAIAASFAMIAVSVGAYLLTTVFAPAGRLADCTGGSVAGGAIGGPFELIDETGRPVTDQDVITKPTLIYFGYVFCPDFCPLDNMRNAFAVDALAEAGFDVGQVFISIDPARDTPDVLQDYTFNFHDDLLGLTGSDEQVAAAAGAYRVFYQRADDDPDFYLMNHSTFTYLVTPEQGFIDFFPSDASPELVAERTACFIDALGLV